MTEDSTAMWRSAIALLAQSGELGQGKVSMLRMTRVLDVDDTLVLVVGSGFAKDVVERSRGPISRALAQVLGYDIHFEVMVDTSGDSAAPPFGTALPVMTEPVPAPPSAPTATEARSEPVVPRMATSTPTFVSPPRSSSPSVPPTATPPSPSMAAPSSTVPPSSDGSRLNPRYTFDTYVQGASNRLARAAAFAVAEAPARAASPEIAAALDADHKPERAYNPLFIYGGSGLGKTHLLHAIGNYARSLYPGIRVKYVSSEEFVSDFISSVADGRMDSFKDRYRRMDILLVDDIQFLGGKEQTLEEFFHTFNALHMEDKQIVLTSDVSPNLLEGFEERLISRFVEGLTADVQPPDLETRAAILSRKAHAEGLVLPDDVMYYIASRVSTNIRELEGALIRVTAFASLTQQPIDQTLAEMVLKDIISDSAAEEITPVLIMAQTADYFGVTIDDLCSKNRSKKQTHARHIAMYLCRELTDLSLPRIGKEFGGRDHTTVINANKNIVRELREERATYNQVAELTARIKQAAQSPSR